MEEIDIKKLEKQNEEMLNALIEIRCYFPAKHKIKLPLSFQVISVCEEIIEKITGKKWKE